MDNSLFEETVENVRNHIDIKLMTTDRRRKKMAPVPNYHATKHLLEKILAIGRDMVSVKVNKLVYLGLSILEISQIAMYKYWYAKPRDGKKAKLGSIDMDSFIVHVKLEDIYADYPLSSIN